MSHLALNPIKSKKTPTLASWKATHPNCVLFRSQSAQPWRKAVAATLKHDFGLRGGVHSDEGFLRCQVPKATFYKKLQQFRTGTYEKWEKMASQMTLSPKAEEEIVEWAIQHWRGKDMQPVWHLRQFAAVVAEGKAVTFAIKDGLPSNRWYFRFLKRHPNLTERTIQHTKSSRLKAQDGNIICAFFQELEEFVASTFPEGIPSGRVGMLDEFGVFISCSPEKTKGVAPRGARQVRLPFFLDGSWVTLVGWGMADGVCGPPTFVLANSFSSPGDLTSQQLGDPKFVGTDHGCVDKETFFLRLKQVFQHTTKCCPQNPFLLFTDGHSNRYTTENLVLAKKLRCHIIVLPPHATHFIGATDQTCHGKAQ